MVMDLLVIFTTSAPTPAPIKTPVKTRIINNGFAIFILFYSPPIKVYVLKPKKHLDRWPDISFKEKRIIQTKKLDTWVKENKISKIDLIWADVQGAERELIKGGIDTFNKKVRYFYTEFSNDELYENQPILKEIYQLLPNFKILGIYGENVLLENKNLKNWFRLIIQNFSSILSR